MPALAPQGAGTAFTFLITFIAGLVTKIIFSSSTDLAQYQPNVIQTEYVTMIQSITATETFFSPLSAPTTFLSSSPPTFSTIAVDSLATPKPGDLIPHPLLQKPEVRGGQATRRREGPDGSSDYQFEAWIEILVDFLLLMHQLLQGQSPVISYFSRPAVVERMKDSANQTDPDDTHKEPIRALESKAQDLVHNIENLTRESLSLAEAKNNEIAKEKCLTKELAELRQETEAIRASVQEEHEENEVWISNARRVQVKYNTEYGKRVASNDRKVAELKRQHEAEIADLRAELQISQRSYHNLQAHSLLQIDQLREQHVKDIQISRAEPYTQDADATMPLHSELEKQQKVHEDLQQKSKLQAAALEDLKEQYIRDKETLNLQLAQKQRIYDEQQKHWVDEVENIYEDHEKDISALKVELNEKHDKECRALEAQLKMLQNSNDELTRQKTDLFAQFDELESDLEERGVRLQTKINNQAGMILVLEAKIKHLSTTTKEKDDTEVVKFLHTAVKEKERIIHGLQAKAALRDRTSPSKGNSQQRFHASTSTIPKVSSNLRSVTNADTDSDVEAEKANKIAAEHQHPISSNNDAESSTPSQILPSTPKDLVVGHEQQDLGSSTSIDVQSLCQRVLQPQVHVLPSQELVVTSHNAINSQSEDPAIVSVEQTFDSAIVTNNQSPRAQMSHDEPNMNVRSQASDIPVIPPDELGYTPTVESQCRTARYSDKQESSSFIIPGLSYTSTSEDEVKSNQSTQDTDEAMLEYICSANAVNPEANVDSTMNGETELDSAMRSLSLSRLEPESAADELCNDVPPNNFGKQQQSNIETSSEQEAISPFQIPGLPYNAPVSRNEVKNSLSDYKSDIQMHEDITSSDTDTRPDEADRNPDSSMQDFSDDEPVARTLYEKDEFLPDSDEGVQGSSLAENMIHQQQANVSPILNQETAFEIPGLTYPTSGPHINRLQPPISDFAFSPATIVPAFRPTWVAVTPLPTSFPSGPYTSAASDQQNVDTSSHTSDTVGPGDAFLADLEIDILDSGHPTSFTNTANVQNNGGAYHTSWDSRSPATPHSNTISHNITDNAFGSTARGNAYVPADANVQLAAVAQYLNLVRSREHSAMVADGTLTNGLDPATIDPQLLLNNSASDQSNTANETYADSLSSEDVAQNAGGSNKIQALLANLRGNMTLSDTYVPTERRANTTHVTRQWTVLGGGEPSHQSAPSTATPGPAGGSLVRRIKLKPKSRRRDGTRGEAVMYEEDLEDFEWT